MSRFHILKGQRVIATADTLAEAQAFAKKSGARVLQVAATVRKNPSPAEHADYAQSDLRLAREAIAIAKRQTNTTDRRDKAKDAIADAKLAKREAKHSGRVDLQAQAEKVDDEAFDVLIGQPFRKNGANTPSYLHLTDYLANAIEHEESPAAAVAYLTRCGYSAALAADVVAQCFSGHCNAEDAVDAALVRHGADLPYRSNSMIEVRHNGADGSHPAEAWVRSKRKPLIDFGEMGNDRQALAKWLGEHPGKTAAFKAAGTVYHSANIGGQVFTVPAARKNGLGPRLAENITIYPTKEMADKVAAELQSTEDDWQYVVVGRKSGGFLIEIFDEDNKPVAVWGQPRHNGPAALQREWMEAQERKNYAWDAIKAFESAGKPVPKALKDSYEAARKEWLAVDRRYEAESAYKPRRNGPSARPDPKIYAEYQNLAVAVVASQDERRKRLRGDWGAMSAEGPTRAEKDLARFAEKIGSEQWDRVTQQALRDSK